MKLGHTHLKVKDLETARNFYCGFLGASVTEQVGESFLFLTFGDSHHEIALQALGPQARRPQPNTVGLYHVAFEVHDASALYDMILKLKERDLSYSLIDHQISWAVYTEDPDGNGIEIYLDRRAAQDGAKLWRGISRALSEAEIANER